MKHLLSLLIAFCFFTAGAAAQAQVARPAEWAQPVATQALENCYRLDDKLFRSAQPDVEGFTEARRLGIQTVLNLRSGHSDVETAAGLRLRLRRIPTEARSLTIEQLVLALRVIRETEGPVLVYCWQGSDRTGAVCALYRVVFQGWSREAAIDELVNGGYGFHDVYDNIPELIRNADIEAIRRQVAGR